MSPVTADAAVIGSEHILIDQLHSQHYTCLQPAKTIGKLQGAVEILIF